MKVKNIQKHDELAKRLYKMASAAISKDNAEAFRHLKQLAEDHERAAKFQNNFIMR